MWGKKTMRIGVAGILMAALLSGCSTSAKTEESKQVQMQSSEAKGLNGKLVIMTNSSGGTFDAVNEIMEEFKKLNPELEIEYSTQGKDYEQLMKAKMAANDLPDIFATHGWSVNRYSEYLIPLNDQGWYSGLVDEIKSVISDADGTIYTLPLNVDKSGIVYNRQILQAMGKDVPKTWDEFLECCEAAKEQGYVPIYLAGKDAGKIAGVLNAVSPSFVITNETHNFIAQLKDGSFDWNNYSPVFELLQTMIDREYFNKDYVTADPITIPQKLAAGEVLFAIENNATMADAYALNAEIKLGMMPIPSASVEDTPVLLGGEREAYGIWKDGKNKEAAKALLEFMALPENIEKVSVASGMPVSMQNAKNQLGAIGESYEENADVRIFSKFDREYLPNGMWSTLKTVGSAFIAGDIDVKKACSMMGEDYLKFMEQSN